MSDSDNEEERPVRKRAPVIVLRDKGIITLPLSVREELDLEIGDTLLLSVEDGRVVLTPAAVVPRVQLPEPPPEPPTPEQLQDEARELCESFGPSKPDFMEQVRTAGISGRKAIDAWLPLQPEKVDTYITTMDKPLGQFDRVPGDEPELPFPEQELPE